VSWVEIEEHGFPPGSGTQDDPYVLVTDGKMIGTGQYLGDCWECVEWLLMSKPKEIENNRYYKETWGYLEKDPVTITHWQHLPKLPNGKVQGED
jgi:hypothetical protein